MSDTQDTTAASPASTLSGRVLAVAFAAVVPILTGAAYLTGVAYYRAYLNSFGIPSKIIEKSSADFFLYAHTAVTESLFIIVTSALAVVLAVIFFSSFLLLALNRLERKAAQSQRIIEIRARLLSRPFINLLADLLLLPTALMFALMYLIFALLLALILPQAIGGATGRQQAAKDLVTFNKDCLINAQDHRFCNAIYENGNLVACGYVIDSSPAYVAVFQSGRVRTIPVAEKTFVTVNSEPNICLTLDAHDKSTETSKTSSSTTSSPLPSPAQR